MTNVTENDIKEIREIKAAIKAAIKDAELSLDKFMTFDLRNEKCRKEMRDILANIRKLEQKLSKLVILSIRYRLQAKR